MKLKRKQKNKSRVSRVRANKEMVKHYKELSETGISELRFKNLCVDYLLSVLDEIEKVTDDDLAKAIVQNSRARHILDKNVHSMLLFKDSNDSFMVNTFKRRTLVGDMFVEDFPDEYENNPKGNGN